MTKRSMEWRTGEENQIKNDLILLYVTHAIIHQF